MKTLHWYTQYRRHTITLINKPTLRELLIIWNTRRKYQKHYLWESNTHRSQMSATIYRLVESYVAAPVLRLTAKQIYEYFDKIFSKYLCGFRKGNSTQHCLLLMLEKLKKALDVGQCTGLLLTDLTKAFDCISRDLLFAKINAYGFSYTSLRLFKWKKTENQGEWKLYHMARDNLWCPPRVNFGSFALQYLYKWFVLFRNVSNDELRGWLFSIWI